MKKIVIFACVLLLVFSFAQADLTEDIAQAKAELVGQKLPGPIGSLFGDQRMNIYITMNDGSELVLGIVTENKVVKSLGEGELEEPTLNVFTTESTLQEVMTSENSFQALQEALDNNDITYQAIGFGNKVKFGVSSFFAKIAGWFT